MYTAIAPTTAPIPKKIGELEIKDFSNYKFRCHYLGDLLGAFCNKYQADLDYIENCKKNKYGIDLTEKQTETAEKVKEKTATQKALTKTDETFLNDVFLKKAKELELVKEKVSNFDYDLEAGTKSVLHTIWNFETLHIKPVLKSKAVRRGKAQEDESIDLVNQVFNIQLSKNTQRFENDYFTGEPDLITDKSVIDIKTCESWETFYSKTEKKANEDYFYQVWAYMLLTDKTQGYIAYTLPSYNEDFIQYKQDTALDQEEAEQEFYNMNFDRIPPNKRIKIFKIQRADIDLNIVHQYLNKCREYLNNLNIQFNNQQPLQ